MAEKKSKITNPEWEELSLGYYIVYDDVVAIISWVEKPICNYGAKENIIDMEAQIRLQNCSISKIDPMESYYVTRKVYETQLKEKSTIYHQEDYWIYDNELKEKTEYDKTPWYMK